MCLQKPNVRVLGCVCECAHICSFDLLVQTKGGKVWFASIKPWFAWCSRWNFQQQTKRHNIRHVDKVVNLVTSSFLGLGTSLGVIEHTGFPAAWSLSPNFQGWIS